jgi:hypothetical protein
LLLQAVLISPQQNQPVPKTPEQIQVLPAEEPLRLKCFQRSGAERKQEKKATI